MSISTGSSLKGVAAHSPQTTASDEMLDERFTILSNSRRRTVIDVLAVNQTIEFSELVREVARREEDLGEDAPVSGEVYNRYRSSLYQSHLPKLKEVGVVSYERTSGTIHMGERYLMFRQQLDAAYNAESPFSTLRNWVVDQLWF